MKSDYSRYLTILFILLQANLGTSCSEGSGRKKESVEPPVTAVNEEVAIKLVKLVSPEQDASFKLKDSVKVLLDVEEKDREPDSVHISFDGKLVASLKSSPWEFTIPSALTKTTGRKSIKISAYRGHRSQNPMTRFVIFYSDIVPKRYGYRVVYTYPHDTEAFTEGLVYDNGILYESTGRERHSSLREEELQTGRVIRQHNLSWSLFGEGITIFGGKIYQVTWENKVGFVYDKQTFKLLNKIYYSTQGWGLTTVGEKIVMSDGSNVLGFYEPELFTMVSRLEVYDNEKKIDSLNELEYIGGEIWANIWMTDLIARIDPGSGKVLGYIDLKGILPESDRVHETDVLNGIAYDAVNNRIFVTGKRWPKLFEIRLTE